MLHFRFLTVILLVALGGRAAPVQAGDLPAVTNGEAVRPALMQGFERRIDIVGSGDSNQLFDGIGWDHGMQYAFVEAGFEMYATGVGSMNENDGLSYGVGYLYKTINIADWADGTLASNSGAPSFFDAYAPGDRLKTHMYSYGAEDVASPGSANNGIKTLEGSPLDTSQTVRGHLCYGRFSSVGNGEINPQFRLGANPWTSYQVLEIPTEGFARDEMAMLTMELPPDPARKNLPFELRYVRTSSATPYFIGNAFVLYQRLENADQPAGFSYSTWAYLGGESSRYFANLIINDPVVTPTYKQYYFEQVRRLQTGDPIIIFWINYGLNDRNETLPSVGPLMIEDGDSAEAFADNHQGIINQIMSDWIASGGDEEDIYFVLMPSHPVSLPDHPELVAYREAAAEVALANPRTAAINLEALADAEEMEAMGDYDEGGHAHLSESGYMRLAELAVNALLSASTPADLDQDGVVGFSDLLLLLAAWGDCDPRSSCPADLDASGSVGFDDLLELLVNWTAQ